jgi:hypothetical protein
VDRGGRKSDSAGSGTGVRAGGLGVSPIVTRLLHDHRPPRAVPARGRGRVRASVLAHRARAYQPRGGLAKRVGSSPRGGGGGGCCGARFPG